MKSFAFRASRPHSRTSAFTLMEVVIVVGIIGVVLAAIWGAAAMVSYRVKINRAVDELNIIAGNVFAYYASQNVSYAALSGANLSTLPLPVPGTSTNFCHYTPTMQGLNASGHANIFPAEMLAPITGDANHPWNQAVTDCSGTVGSAQVSLACTTSGGACATTSPNPVLFAVRYSSIEKAPASGVNDVCVQMLIRNSIPGPDTRLKDVVVTWSGGVQTIFTDTGTTSPCSAGNTTCVLPISVPSASVVCKSGTAGQTLTIDWYYQLGG